MTLRKFLKENDSAEITAEELIERKLKSILLLIDHLEENKQYKKRQREIYDSLRGFIEDTLKKKSYEY